MMSSRLYAAAFSSDESESEEDVPEKKIEQRFVRVQSDSEDEKRVVRSAKDKRQEEIQNVLCNLKNHKKIKDMTNVMLDFDELVKLYEKAVKMNEVELHPKFYIQCLAQLEDFINESWEQKKSLSKPAAKSLTNLKQRIKRYNKDFEEKIKEYREHPELFKEESEKEEEEEEEEDIQSNEEQSEEEDKVVSAPSAAKGSADVKDSDDSDFTDSDTSSSFDSDDDISKFGDNPAAYFLRTEVSEKKVKAETKPRKKRKDRPKVYVEDEEDEEGEWRSVDTMGRAEPVIQAFEKGVEVTPELVIKKVSEIIANRGKRTSSISEQIGLLDQVIAKITELHMDAGIHVSAMMSMITVLFDYESKHPAFMPIIKFKKVIEQLDSIFDVLKDHNAYITISETVPEDTEFMATKPYLIKGSILAAVSRLDMEYYKILQNANGHEIEYDERLQFEPMICSLLDKLIEYLTLTNAPSDAFCVAYMHKVEHMYYKYDFEWRRRVNAEGEEAVGQNPSFPIVERLCQYIYKNDKTDRLRTRAILCHIYYLALFDYWYKARDLMLMSNLQASIDHADQSTMILYNRAMVQMGLCAFRAGHIRDTHSTLSDLTGSGRIRELLAQGLHMQPRYERTPEEEKREKAHQVPYHMHINTELIECVYLISAMLQEMPNLAASQDNEMRTRVFSKAFMMALRIHERSTLVCPPETPRDHVIAASKAMRVGDWHKCLSYIINPKMETKIWVLFNNPEKVKKMLQQKIKEECLRCYLFTFSSVHECLNLSRLAEHFELPKSLVYSIISKMIINQELAGSLEVPADFLTMHKGERSRLQTLALQLADKVNSIVEMNEKLIENRGGLIPGPKNMQSYQGRRYF